MKKIVLLIIAAMALTTIYAGSPISVSGRGDAPYTNIIGKPGKEVEDQAIQAAIIDSINRALENQSEALREQFKSVGKSITVDDYIKKGIVTQSRKPEVMVDPKERKVTALFEGTMDLTSLRDAMNSTTPTAAATPTVNLSKAEAAVFFTCRETSENIVQRVGVSAVGSSAKNKEAEANQTASDTGVSTSETSLTQSKESLNVTESTKSDVQKYRLDAPSREILGAGMLARFSSKGFESIVDGSMMDSSADLDKAFGSGDAVPASVWKKVAADVRTTEPSIKYLVVGTVDFSIPTKDPVSGMTVESGTVSGKVYALNGAGLPRVVAALEPQDQKQSAPTQQDAKKRVIAKLSEQAADDIITKLHNKNGL